MGVSYSYQAVDSSNQNWCVAVQIWSAKMNRARKGQPI